MRLLLVIVLGCAAFLPAGGAVGATTINFDELSADAYRGPPFNGDTYIGQGVRFSTTGAGLFVTGTRGLDSTDTPPNGIYASSTLQDSFADRPVIATFVTPGTTTPTTVGTVSFFVVDGPNEPAAERWSAEIFGLDGASLARQTGTDMLARVTFPRAQADVARLVFTPSGDLESFDTLTFELPEPGAVSLLAIGAALVLRRRRRATGW